MSYLCIMTFWFCLAESRKLHKRHVVNYVVPPPEPEKVYNISSWVKSLHLQQCVIVEIGNRYCAVFVEYRTVESELKTKTEEYFLGICDIETLRRWRFCSQELERERPDECTFLEHPETSSHPARVHRRLCDVSSLAIYGQPCNCDTLLVWNKLYRVTGFPTCFQIPLPNSICNPANVCGINTCSATTVNRKVHSIKCNPNCRGQQPFCEDKHLITTRPSPIHSFWSDWAKMSHHDEFEGGENELVYSEASCLTEFTGKGAIDCLGPGTNCCPPGIRECSCHVYSEDGMLKLFRVYNPNEPDVLRKKRYSLTNPRNLNGNNIRKAEQFPYNGNALKRKTMKRRTVSKVEEYEDDDEDVNDDGSDDIILEEDTEDSERQLHTTEKKERDELRQEGHTVPVKGLAVAEMNEDLDNQTTTNLGSNILIYYTISWYNSFLIWLAF